jgi:hypothetical protein
MGRASGTQILRREFFRRIEIRRYKINQAFFRRIEIRRYKINQAYGFIISKLLFTRYLGMIQKK